MGSCLLELCMKSEVWLVVCKILMGITCRL
jgi:hypothetical protein